MSLHTPDTYAICDEDTADDPNAEWRAQAWEAVDDGKATAAEVASAEEVLAYSAHLVRGDHHG